MRIAVDTSHRPVTAISAARALSLGGATAGHGVTAVGWIAGLPSVALATARIRRSSP